MNTSSTEHRPTLIRQWSNNQVNILVTSILYPFRVWVQTFEVMPTATAPGYLASESSYDSEQEADIAFNDLIRAQEHRTVIKPEIYLQSLHDGMHVIVTVKQKGIDWLTFAELKDKDMQTINMVERGYLYGGWPTRNEMLTDIIDLVQQHTGLSCTDVREGTSQDPHNEFGIESACPDCGGDGQQSTNQDHVIPGISFDCPRCDGTGLDAETREANQEAQADAESWQDELAEISETEQFNNSEA